MNILWLTPMLPCLRSGGQVRQWHLLRCLAPRHTVRVIALLLPHEQPDVAPLRALGVQLETVSYQPPPQSGGWANRARTWGGLLLDPHPAFARVFPVERLRAPLRAAIARSQPDVVYLDQLFTAPLGAELSHLPWLLQTHNAESDAALSQLAHEPRLARRIFGRIDARKLRRWERVWLRRSTICLTVSELDSATLHRLAPATPIQTIPNGVATADFAPPDGMAGARKDLLFFGNLAYPPNADALFYFCREILPRIRQHSPHTTLKIVGANATPSVRALGAQPGVDVVGYVPDVRPCLWAAAACVVPLRSGGGTRFKILEALAAGCAVVSTAKGAEGLALAPARDFALADDPPRFAAATLRVLTDPAYRDSLASSGQAAVRARYDWSQLAPALERACADAITRFQR